MRPLTLSVPVFLALALSTASPAGEPLQRTVQANPLVPALAGEDATEIIALTPDALRQLQPEKHFSTGLDALERDTFKPLDHQRLLVLTHWAAVDIEGRHLLEVLLNQRRPKVVRVLLFDDGMFPGGRSPELDRILLDHPEVRVFPRTASEFRPAEFLFDEIDKVLIDIPLRGWRQAGDIALVAGLLGEASIRSLPVVVLDRPPLLSASRVEGPTPDASLLGTAEAYLPIPIAPGVTTAEAVRLFNGPYAMQARVQVYPMTMWDRGLGVKPLHDALEKLDSLRYGRCKPVIDLLENASLRSAAELATKLAPPGVAIASSDVTTSLTVLAPRSNSAGFISAVGWAVSSRDDIALTSTTTGLVLPPKATREDSLLRVRVDDGFRPVLFAVGAWGGLGKSQPDIYPQMGQPGPLGVASLYGALRNGLSPDQMRQAWEASKPYSDYLKERQEILLYP